MNCHDITRMVDSGKCSDLTHKDIRDAEEHARSCRTCAPQWLAHMHLDALEIPQIPSDALTRSLAIADGTAQASKSGRARRVTIVVGCVMALAAAAAMLLTSVSGTPSPHRANLPNSATTRETATRSLEESAGTTQPATLTTTQSAANSQDDMPLFPPQYAADLAFEARRTMALGKLVTLHPELTEPLATGMLYDATIQLRADARVLAHSVRTLAPEDLHWSRYDSNWGGLPGDGGEVFGDFAAKGTPLADGRTLGADLQFRHLLVHDTYDPARSDRRVEQIMREQRAGLPLPVDGIGAGHVTVLLSAAGTIEREVAAFTNQGALREREAWSASRRAEAMAGVLGVSTDEIGLMGSVPVLDEASMQGVLVDYAWRRMPGESGPRHGQTGWDRFNPQGVDVATALAIVERVMPDAFLGDDLERALGIPAILLTEEGEFIRTARIRSSDPREDLPGISIATFRMLVLKNGRGATSAVYFMWEGAPHEYQDPRAPTSGTTLERSMDADNLVP